MEKTELEKMLNKIKDMSADGGKWMLTKTAPVSVMYFKNKDVRKVLRELYKSPKLEHRLMGTLLNAILYEKKAVFLLTYPILSSLLATDKNQRDRKTISWEEYKIFIGTMGSYDVIKRLTDRNERGVAYAWMFIFEGLAQQLYEDIGGVEKLNRLKQEIIAFTNKETLSANTEKSDTITIENVDTVQAKATTRDTDDTQAGACPSDSVSEETEDQKIKRIFMKFKGGLPENPKDKSKHRKSYLKLFFEQLKENNIEKDYITSGLKEKLISCFIPPMERAGMDSSKYEEWFEDVVADVEGSIGAIFDGVLPLDDDGSFAEYGLSKEDQARIRELRKDFKSGKDINTGGMDPEEYMNQQIYAYSHPLVKPENIPERKPFDTAIFDEVINNMKKGIV